MNISAQDLITTKKGEDIKAKIMEIGLNEIKYKRADNLDGPLITVSKSDILLIRYENGTKEIFEDKKEETKTENANNGNDNFTLTRQAEMDAQKYYRGYKGPKLGTFLVTTFTGPFGLIPAITNSAGGVKEKHFANNNQPDLFKNPIYYDAYYKKAKSIKSRKTWGGFLWGVIIFVGVFGALSTAGS